MGGESMAAAALYEDENRSVDEAPIVSSYNHQIRPLLNTLRHFNIVVVGDQSSGKSSVLGSLAGITLPTRQGICTRVPLIMRLQNHPNPNPQLFLEFNGKIVPTDEHNIAVAISAATEEIAGTGKGISSNPVTLVVKRRGVPHLTMVDLPGITGGEEDDISRQIIMEYITPDETIIVNVLSAASIKNFSTCESSRMCKKVDKTGQRTLAVVTKADKFPTDIADEVDIGGLGCVIVRNRIGDESFSEARAEEAKLFQNDPLLSKVNRSNVGIPVLAERLVNIQAVAIVRKINQKRTITSVDEAMRTFMCIFGSAKYSLTSILLEGEEFDELPDVNMYGTVRVAKMVARFFEELRHEEDQKFLVEEIKVLEETMEPGLPGFLSKTSFLTLLQKKVKGISTIALDFVDKVWSYVKSVILSVLLRHSNYNNNHPQLVSCTTRAVENLIAKKLQQSVDWVNHIVEMEELSDYTCSPEYSALWRKLMLRRVEFIRTVENKTCNITIEEFGNVNVDHLYELRDECILLVAFELKVTMTAYWGIVVRRMVDNMALHVRCSIHNLVNKEMEMEIINELIGSMGNGLETILYY